MPHRTLAQGDAPDSGFGASGSNTGIAVPLTVTLQPTGSRAETFRNCLNTLEGMWS